MFRAFLIALFLLLPSVSGAQTIGAGSKAESGSTTPMLMLHQFEASHPEKVLMAYNKVAGTTPDLNAWAQQSPYLKDAKEIDKSLIVNREYNRLSQAYNTYDGTAELVVHTRVFLDDYSTLQELLTISEFTPKTFFSYSLYGQNVAIVPKGIAGFGTIKVTNAQMDEMLKKAGQSAVKAELVLKPVMADSKAPFVYGDKSYWLMLADIAEIRFWADGEEPKLLWLHRADWYKPKEDKALLDLKLNGLGM